ncbi:unnamed protein product, partial [Schistosoma turkestanicum]
MDPPTSTDVNNGADINSTLGITNSMGTSFATTTATTAPLHPYSFVETNDSSMNNSTNHKTLSYHELNLLHNLKPMINKLSLLDTVPPNEDGPCWLTLKLSQHRQSSSSSSSSGGSSCSSSRPTTGNRYHHFMNYFKHSSHKVSYTNLSSLHKTTTATITTTSNHVTNSMMIDSNKREDNKLNNTSTNHMNYNEAEEHNVCRHVNLRTGLLNLLCFNCSKQCCCCCCCCRELEQEKPENDTGLMKNQWSMVDMLYFATIIYIPFLILFGFIHLLVMPKSILLLIASSIATAYITLQLVIIGAVKRFA